MALAGFRLAIVTMWDGSPTYACAVLHWCQHAQRLAESLGAVGAQTDLFMIMSNNRSQIARQTIAEDCPNIHVVQPDALGVLPIGSVDAQGICTVILLCHI